MKISTSTQSSRTSFGHMLKALGLCSKTVGFTFFVVLILVAAYVAAGRIFVPSASQYRTDIENSLSEILDASVSIERLEGDWKLFSPVVSIQGLIIELPDAEVEQRSLVINQLTLELDVPRSIWARDWVIGEVSISGVMVDVVEVLPNRWTVRGFPLSDKSNGLDQLVDVLLNTRKLELSQASVLVERNSGKSVILDQVNVNLKNRGERHELNVRSFVNEQVSPLNLAVEIQGDPRTNVSGEIYVGFEEFDFQPLLSILDIEQTSNIESLNGSAELWFRRVQNGVPVAHVNFKDGNITFAENGTSQALQFSNLRGQFSAIQPAEEHWQLWAEGFGFKFNDLNWTPENLYLDYQGGSDAGLEIQSSALNLLLLDALATSSAALPEQAQSALTALSPSGKLTNTKMKFYLDDEASEYFSIQGNLEDVAVSAWQGAPAGRGLNGYVEITGSNEAITGFAEIDSSNLALFLPKIFAEEWEFSSTKSRVYWNVSDQKVRVHSNVIEAENDFMDGRVQFELLNTRNAEDKWDSDLTLLIGVPRMNAAYKSLFLPTIAQIETTMGWLEKSIRGGDIYDSAFIYRGSTKRGAGAAEKSTQAFFNVNNARVRFLPDWPLLERAKAYVEVRNVEVDVESPEAAIAGIALRNTKASVRPTDHGPWLSLSGEGEGNTGAGIAFLKNSPAGAGLRNSIASWQGNGQINLGIELGIPLNNESPIEDEVLVKVDSINSMLEMTDLGLRFEELNGYAEYHSLEGLKAPSLRASLFGYPVQAHIETEDFSNIENAFADQATQIHLDGRVNPAALSAWSLQTDFVRKILEHATGEVDYQADFTFFKNAAKDGVQSRLHIQSPLQGLAFDLPRPMQKQSDQSQLFEMMVNFFPEREVVELRFEDLLSGRLLMEEEEIINGRIHLGDQLETYAEGELIQPQELSGEGLAVLGNVNYFHFERWQEVLESMSSEQSDQSGISSLISLIEVDIDELDIFDRKMNEMKVRLRPNSDRWYLFVENPEVSGNIEIPHNDVLPWLVRLNYLRLPEEEEKMEFVLREEELEEIDVLANVNPGQLPPFDFSTAELSLGDANVGRWSFSLRPNDMGAVLTNFQALMSDARIVGQNREGGAELDWRYMDGEHTTFFSGLFEAGDLATVLPPLGVDAFMESEEASFVGELLWHGSPANFSLTDSTGEVSVNIQEGRFVNIDSGSSRIFGAFNLDSLVRRLQLDFSDLYKSGLAYDSIEGDLLFDDGLVITQGPFIVDGPSSKIALEGQINLVEETISAEMLVNVPLGQNISVLAGLLGAWPVAISTYLASQLFADEVEGMTAIVYTLEGPWNQLQAGFEPATELEEDNFE